MCPIQPATPRPGAAHHTDQRRERQTKAAEAFSEGAIEIIPESVIF
jgi:hypothetical protein